MSIRGFSKLAKKKVQPISVADVTLRDFSGGLKVVDNEFTLKNNYFTKLINLIPQQDNSLKIRFGTKFKKRLTGGYTTAPLSCYSFNNQMYFGAFFGNIIKLDENFVQSVVWSNAIANALPGAPAGWSNFTTPTDWTEFKNKLIIVNPQDKPLILGSNTTASYLQDLATGTNINTPIGTYVTSVSDYVIIGGIPGNDTLIYISSKGTSGTWPGDPAPNDAISFDVGGFVSKGSSKIKGLFSFKNQLLILFDNCLLAFTLGIYTANVHKPQLIANYDEFRCLDILVNNSEILVTTDLGVFVSKQNSFNNVLSFVSISKDIDSLYLNLPVASYQALEEAYIAHSAINKTIFISVYQGQPNSLWLIGQYKKSFEDIKWAQLSGWTSPFVPIMGVNKKLYFYDGLNVFLYGSDTNKQEEFTKDFISLPENVEGVPIPFEAEFPWLDAGNRNKAKILKRLSFETLGKAVFTLQCFVNNFYKNTSNVLTPAVTMDMVAGEETGFGLSEEGFGAGEFGGGRNTRDERFFGIPLSFKILKLRISGSTNKALSIISLSMIYVKGGYKP